MLLGKRCYSILILLSVLSPREAIAQTAPNTQLNNVKTARYAHAQHDVIEQEQMKAFQLSAKPRLMPSDSWFLSREYEREDHYHGVRSGRWIEPSMKLQ
jgi:hypothetical protein